jgi:hypothetical protein
MWTRRFKSSRYGNYLQVEEVVVLLVELVFDGQQHDQAFALQLRVRQVQVDRGVLEGLQGRVEAVSQRRSRLAEHLQTPPVVGHDVQSRVFFSHLQAEFLVEDGEGLVHRQPVAVFVAFVVELERQLEIQGRAEDRGVGEVHAEHSHVGDPLAFDRQRRFLQGQERRAGRRGQLPVHLWSHVQDQLGVVVVADPGADALVVVQVLREQPTKDSLLGCRDFVVDCEGLDFDLEEEIPLFLEPDLDLGAAEGQLEERVLACGEELGRGRDAESRVAVGVRGSAVLVDASVRTVALLVQAVVVARVHFPESRRVAQGAVEVELVRRVEDGLDTTRRRLQPDLDSVEDAWDLVRLGHVCTAACLCVDAETAINVLAVWTVWIETSHFGVCTVSPTFTMFCWSNQLACFCFSVQAKVVVGILTHTPDTSLVSR